MNPLPFYDLYRSKDAMGRGMVCGLCYGGPLDDPDENRGLSLAEDILKNGGTDREWAIMLDMASMSTDLDVYNRQIWPREPTSVERRLLKQVNLLENPTWAGLAKFLEL